MTAAVAVLLAAALDTLLVEPPRSIHPVAWFGRAVTSLDRPWPAPAVVSLVLAAVFPLGAAAVAAAAVTVAARAAPALAVAVAAVVLFVCVSLRMLLSEAAAVVAATDADLPAARRRLRSLAGRDADELSAGEVRSAAVESLAENLADGLVAPLFAFAVAAAVAPSALALPAAAGAAAWVKGVNTLDSMVGYRSNPVGRIPARLDDAVMFVPARLSALLVVVATGTPHALVAARRAAHAPPSPNSGWPMATLAAALGVRLRKPDVYDLDFGDLPTVDDAARARGVVRRAGLLSYLVAGVVAWS